MGVQGGSEGPLFLEVPLFLAQEEAAPSFHLKELFVPR
jgi:hypothetical protein